MGMVLSTTSRLEAGAHAPTNAEELLFLAIPIGSQGWSFVARIEALSVGGGRACTRVHLCLRERPNR